MREIKEQAKARHQRASSLMHTRTMGEGREPAVQKDVLRAGEMGQQGKVIAIRFVT